MDEIDPETGEKLEKPVQNSDCRLHENARIHAVSHKRVYYGTEIPKRVSDPHEMMVYWIEDGDGSFGAVFRRKTGTLIPQRMALIAEVVTNREFSSESSEDENITMKCKLFEPVWMLKLKWRFEILLTISYANDGISNCKNPVLHNVWCINSLSKQASKRGEVN